MVAIKEHYSPARNIKWARHVNTRPIPKSNSTWAKVGLAYERRVVSALIESGYNVLHNPGFEYEDDKGLNYCVPDIIIKPNNRIVIIECKLTYKPEAILKVRQLYAPVVALALNYNAPLSLIVTKNLTPFAPEPLLNLESALCQQATSTGIVAQYLIQWLGKGAFPAN